ncbi:MAG TPA: type I polyketide synthase [Trebonia sp.]|nr:type I polyketide synthase [Trebonia sp.]
MSRIAIVGMGCQYPEADSPTVLWRNVLAARRSFREIPPERVDLADYHSADHSAPDVTYGRLAALLEDYHFDRLAFSIPGPLFRSSDTVHWLALDVAKRALDDATFDQLPVDRRRVSVLIGNTLTGDHTRSGTLRVRWPYVRRAVAATLAEHGLSARLPDILPALEHRFKQPFNPVNEESLAGGLSNTISGRICNYFDFGGGGYTIDGACSSSLLAVIHSSISLYRHDVDFALAGGVDLSIDPFELVGFAKASALAERLMRIYDAHSEGFWPGEGCGIVALAREDDAARWGLPVYAYVTGFGVSSDGHGGITRPEADGHALAIKRAYDLAGYGPDAVSLFEGHGTGTKVGDAAEVAAISSARRESGASTAAPLGSIKANIGHTKAAAGVAGLLKTVMSVHAGVLPPTTGCESPLEALTRPDRMLEIRRTATAWPAGLPRRAAVSAIGFGGINTHVTVEESSAVPRGRLWAVGSAVSATAQDAELVPLAAASLSELAGECQRMAAAARELTFGRMSDLAINAARDLLPGQRARAAVIARTPAELAERCAQVAALIGAGVSEQVTAGYAFSARTAAPRVGFLFSGQGSPVRFTAGALGRRFEAADRIVADAALHRSSPHDTGTAQPAIVAGSAAALAVLAEIGIDGCVAVGHSLGELAALHWAGALSGDELISLAKARGRAMSACGPERGAMAQVSADEDRTRELIAGLPLTIAAFNAADLTVISGPGAAVQAAVRRAAVNGMAATALKVSHAFHSPLVAASAEAMATWFGSADAERAVRRPVVSTVTGALLPDRIAAAQLLASQITAPVLFTAALGAMAERADLLVEVGPGRVLADLAARTGLPALTVDAGAEDLAPFLGVAGAGFALGAPVALDLLVRNRVSFSTDPLRRPAYLVNPCELIDKPPAEVAVMTGHDNPRPGAVEAARTQPGPQAAAGTPVAGGGAEDGVPGPEILDVVRELVAGKAELPASAISESSAFLADLNLNSIAVAQIAADAAKAFGRKLPQAASQLTEGTVRELVELLQDSPAGIEQDASDATGVAQWVRAFTVSWEPRRHGGLRRSVNWRLSDGCTAALRATFPAAPADPPAAATGLVVTLDEITTGESAWRAVDTLAGIARDRDLARVVICHHGGAASLARTLYIERPDLAVRLIDAASLDAATTAERQASIRRECEAGDGFEELRFRAGQVLVPRLAEERIDGGQPALGADDTIVVSGGGKGIGAEAALSLGKELGVKVGIIGRSDARADDEVQASLARMTVLGIQVHYARADVTDPAAVKAAVHEIAQVLGPVTGIVHSAGANTPALLTSLTPDSVAATWRAKVTGLENLLAAVDPASLRLLVAFGSSIGRTGMRGEAHYAIANERLRTQVEAFAGQHPACRSLAIEWSVWSGVGMGAKLGLLDSLGQLGVHPIPPEQGISMLQALIAAKAPDVAPVVSGRLGPATGTLPLRERDLPFYRFIENPLVHYPGIELVAETILSAETDRYLSDHALDGTFLLPMVVGVEAMAQVAMGLSGQPRVALIGALRFEQPITVPADGGRRIRVAALRRPDGQVDVTVRSDETGFEVVHLSASYAFDADGEPARQDAGTAGEPREPLPDSPRIVASLYRDLLFHGPAFQLVTGFRRVQSTRCLADVEIRPAERLFIDYLPQDTVLGAVIARDACLHAAQACIPHRRVLPVAAAEVTLVRPPRTSVLHVESVERSRGRREVTFDMTVRDGTGAVVETWAGLRLRVMADLPLSQPLPPDLVAAYLERSLEAQWGSGHRCQVALKDTSSASQDHRGELAVSLATEGAEQLSHRPGGAPELRSGLGVSLSHHAGYTLVLLSDRRVGADIESVESRPESTWAAMLGAGSFNAARLLAQSSGEDLNVAATRAWSAIESLRKAGVAGDISLTADDPPDGDWACLSCGTARAYTVTTRLPGVDGLVVVAATAATASDVSVP